MSNNVTIDKLTSQLRESGLRLTPQRLAILRILQEAGDHLAPIEIYDRARSLLPGLTEPTVYRTLESLVREGLAQSTYTGSGKLMYEAGGHEHHHIVCRSCGDEIEIDHNQLEEFYKRLEQVTEYKLITSHLTFFGLCPNCQ